MSSFTHQTHRCRADRTGQTPVDELPRHCTRTSPSHHHKHSVDTLCWDVLTSPWSPLSEMLSVVTPQVEALRAWLFDIIKTFFALIRQRLYIGKRQHWKLLQYSGQVLSFFLNLVVVLDGRYFDLLWYDNSWFLWIFLLLNGVLMWY